MSGQLVLPFATRPALRPEDFVVAPGNEAAFRFIRRWPDWPSSWAALHGPAGSGKSHLAAVWRSAAKAALFAASDLSPERLAREALEPGMAVVIEDVDRSEPSEARDRALLLLFERATGFLLLTGRRAPSEWGVAVADLGSRFASLLAFPVWAPDDRLLSALIVKHFADRQLHVPDSAVLRILSHVERTPEAIADFVARADEKALAERRAISERLILELIAAEGPRSRA